MLNNNIALKPAQPDIGKHLIKQPERAGSKRQRA